MSYWPDGISIDSVSSPIQILENAKEEFENKSKNILSLSWSQGVEKLLFLEKQKTKNKKP